MEQQKYFKDNKAVIDQPCIITISKSSISIEHASATETEAIPDGGLIILVGNTESYNPTPINTEPLPEVNPTQPDNPGGSGEEPGGDTPGGDTPGGDTPVDPTPQNPDIPTDNTQQSFAIYTGGNGIKFVLINNTGSEARFSGGVVLNLSKNPNDWANSTQAYSHMHAPTVGSSYAYNDIIIPAGESYTSPEITTITGIYQPGTNFTDGSWYFMNSDNGIYVHSIYLYTRIYSRSKDETSGSNHMYTAVPLQNTKLQRGYTYYLNLNWKNPDASLDPDKSGEKYIILAENKTSLLPTS